MPKWERRKNDSHGSYLMCQFRSRVWVVHRAGNRKLGWVLWEYDDVASLKKLRYRSMRNKYETEEEAMNGVYR